MSEEVKTDVVVEVKTDTVTDTVNKTVTNIVKNSSATVIERLTNMHVEREIVRRVDLLDKGFAKLADLNKEFKKIKPDVPTFSPTGEKTESYSKDAFDKRTKAKEQLDKLTKVLETAVAGSDSEAYNKLAECIK